jgi:hypothetical protein
MNGVGNADARFGDALNGEAVIEVAAQSKVTLL